MRRECHKVFLIGPTAILGEIQAKKCFDLKSYVAFITDRLQPNFHWL
jgi:hypothetical protein